MLPALRGDDVRMRRLLVLLVMRRVMRRWGCDEFAQLAQQRRRVREGPALVRDQVIGRMQQVFLLLRRRPLPEANEIALVRRAGLATAVIRVRISDCIGTRTVARGPPRV